MTAPARRQYLEIKAQYQDAILLYQVGDFYETFDDDARIAAHELQIVLTGRSYGTDERIPLAGVPVHALDNYAAKLVARGYKVAICEQVSLPGKGLVRREVTRILTPGTVVSPNMVPPGRDNYLVAIALARRSGRRGQSAGFEGAGLACIDASTGVFSCTQWSSDGLADAVRAELERLAPAEIITSDAFSQTAYAGDERENAELPWQQTNFLVTACAAHFFETQASHLRLCQHFQTPTLAAFVPESQTLAIAAAGAIVAYIERMNPSLLSLVSGLRHYETRDLVEIDGRTWRALEVVESAHATTTTMSVTTTRQHGRALTLLATLDSTRTLMGSRHLRRTLLTPLRDRLVLEDRLDALHEIYNDIGLQQRMASALDGLCDLERLTARVVQGIAVPRELLALRIGLQQADELGHVLRGVQAPALQSVQQAIDPCPDVSRLIEEAIADIAQHPGQTIRPGYSAELDMIVASIAEARAWIAGLEAIERERTGIKSLKVGFNKVFGYYLEVSNANFSRVPADYQRRQTLVNGERYVTTELKEHETLVTNAEEQITELETRLYRQVLSEAALRQERLRSTAQAVAQVDVWLSLALVARARGYVRPELSDATDLHIEEGRHPIIEASLEGVEFIANATHLDPLSDNATGTRIVLLTGPNMAGKSTYLRQVATIVLMAQIGSFVPARAARIGLVDRISCRVGAEDDLARGLSTFMMEMVETAYILRQATARSLVILDEVGRGTSTHDGLAIARAVIEHLHDTVGARTLFATHYHELAALARSLAHLNIFQMAIVERDGAAIFLHRVVPGASTQSYGIQVARMAGVPAVVTERAAAVLAESFLNGSATGEARVAEHAHLYSAEVKSAAADANVQDQVAEALLLEAGLPGEQREAEVGAPREIALALASLNIAAMTPLDAINILFSLQRQALVALRMDQ